MVKFEAGDKVRITKGSQMGNIGIIEKVLPAPCIETEYHLSFTTKPYYMTLPESSIRSIMPWEATDD